jgi:hypothetical protein
MNERDEVGNRKNERKEKKNLRACLVIFSGEIFGAKKIMMTKNGSVVT